MKAFIRHTGIAAPILRSNIDTDAIIPSREVRQVSKKGLADGLFADWRYVYENGEKLRANPEFVLNQTDYENTTILLAGNNFGCGSSREYAVWALMEYGIRAIIAPSFGSIFSNNCVRNGLLTIELAKETIDSLNKEINPDPKNQQLLIDLEECVIESPRGDRYEFHIPELVREMLLNGLDSISMTLREKERITSFIKRDKEHRRWAYLD